MRLVKIVNGLPGLNTVEVIKIVAKQPIDKGVTFEEMRNRLRVLDVAEAANEETTELKFEDSDYTLLTKLTREFRFGTVSRELMNIIDGILESPKA